MTAFRLNQIKDFHLRWTAGLLWVMASCVVLGLFQWQHQLDTEIRYKLVKKSNHATDVMTQVLTANANENPGNPLQITHGLEPILSRLSDEIDLGSQGFLLLLTDSGEILHYPDRTVLGQSIFSLSETQYPLLEKIAAQLQRGNLATFIHPVTQREQWIVLAHLEKFHLRLCLVIDADELRHNFFKLDWLEDVIWSVVIAGVFICLASLKLPSTPQQRMNRLYLAFSVCLFAYLMMLWSAALAPQVLSAQETLVVDNESAALARQSHFRQRHTRGVSPRLYLKLDIQSIDLLNADQVSVIGRIALRGNAGETLPAFESDQVPVLLNNALSTRWTLLRATPDAEIWQFVATIKQPFDYESFPFDREIISLSFTVSPQAEQYVLIPDFDHYSQMLPESLPGIDMPERDFGSWRLRQTFFSYQTDHMISNTFHLKDERSLNLKYNMVIQRILTGPLISHIMPLLVISFLTYCMLLLWTKDEQQQSLWGFSTAVVLQYCASLFFILVIAHVALRDQLNAQGVIFIEYFYFLAYLQIIFTAVGALLYTTDKEFRLFEYQQGIHVKQWYWPGTFIVSLLITLVFIGG